LTIIIHLSGAGEGGEPGGAGEVFTHTLSKLMDIMCMDVFGE